MSLVKALSFQLLGSLVLLATLQTTAVAATGQQCSPGSICVNANSGDDPLAKESAREHKESWDDSRSLRRKTTNRAEKQFDKYDQAIDDKEKCDINANINAYWEPNNRRCLDRKTGRPLY